MSKSITGCIGHSAGTYKPSSIEATDNVVALRLIDSGAERKVAGIIIPESTEINNRLGFYEVLSVGDKAREDYDLNEGDYIYADRLAVYYDTNPTCVMKYENIICAADKDGQSLRPLKDMVFVDEIKQDDVYEDKTSKLMIASKTHHIPIGIITATNIDRVKYPAIEVGSKIIMTSGADQVTIKGQTFRIYKPDMIIATIED